jgi:hypothetical protein
MSEFSTHLCENARNQRAFILQARCLLLADSGHWPDAGIPLACVLYFNNN